MEYKNRTLIATVTIVLIVITLLASFGIPIFFQDIPQVVLPNVDDLTDPDNPFTPDVLNENFIPVELTLDTVQSVVATLERYTSYYRTITVEQIWGGESDQCGSMEIKTWVDGGFTKVETQMPNGHTQHYIVGNGQLYLWYDKSGRWSTWSVEEQAGDMIQQIPTYEDVLRLDPRELTQASYEEKNSVPCVFVERTLEEMDYLERYWVSTDNGLLIASETVKDGAVVLKMSSLVLESPVPDDTVFALPDGTVLHSLGVTDSTTTSEQE